MIRLNYKVRAVEPILHGSENQGGGNKRQFRRERVKLTAPIVERSMFPTDDDRRRAAVTVLFGVYNAIDRGLKKDYYGYYEQMASNILDATRVRTPHEFLNTLMESCSVRSLHSDDTEAVRKAIDSFQPNEFMSTMKNETQYLMIMLRHFLKDGKRPDDYETTDDISGGGNTFRKHFDDVPVVHANAVGGLLRRLLIRDYFARIGYDRDSMGVNKSTYHELMTGGNISESTGQIDLHKKERIAYLCPAIGLLGSALGNMTTTSPLKIGSLRPVCAEHGFEGEPSFWEMLGTSFGTRHDTSKSETEITIPDNTDKRNADQMIYHNEVLNAGTEMFGNITLVSDDPLIVSVFWKALELWKDYGYIAGRSARGYSRIECDIEIPDGATELYEKHVETVKKDAVAHFTVRRELTLGL